MSDFKEGDRVRIKGTEFGGTVTWAGERSVDIRLDESGYSQPEYIPSAWLEKVRKPWAKGDIIPAGFDGPDDLPVGTVILRGWDRAHWPARKGAGNGWYLVCDETPYSLRYLMDAAPNGAEIIHLGTGQ